MLFCAAWNVQSLRSHSLLLKKVTVCFWWCWCFNHPHLCLFLCFMWTNVQLSMLKGQRRGHNVLKTHKVLVCFTICFLHRHKWMNSLGVTKRKKWFTATDWSMDKRHGRWCSPCEWPGWTASWPQRGNQGCTTQTGKLPGKQPATRFTAGNSVRTTVSVQTSVYFVQTSWHVLIVLFVSKRSLERTWNKENPFIQEGALSRTCCQGCRGL